MVFALPGAFTPTCSSTHLPGYEANYDMIRKEGIDEVYCLSVNDVRETYTCLFLFGLVSHIQRAMTHSRE